MILKVKRYKTKNNDQDWWYFDNIRKVSTEPKYFFNLKDLESYCSEKNPYSILLDFCDTDMAKAIDSCKTGVNAIHTCYAVCRLMDGNELTVLFDTQAFLLNDEGKTIDRIVCNIDPSS